MTGACFTAPMMSWEDRCAAIVGTWVADARRLARFSQDALGGRVGVSVVGAVRVAMPRLSDSMEEGTIVRWLKASGDAVAAGEPIVVLVSGG